MSCVPPAINISDLTVAYNGVMLFQQFQLTIVAKQWNCLLGATGVGKSSLLRLIAQLPLATQLEYHGRITASDQQSLIGRISYLPQQDSLLPWLTVFDNLVISYHLKQQPITTQLKQRIRQLLALVNLTQYQYLKPSALSGGMRQLVGVIRIFLENRPIVLLDEPFSALDFQTRLQVQNLAARLLKQHTILLVTHDPIEALRLGEQLHLLAGRPTKVQQSMHLTTTIPRAANDPQLLTDYAFLVQLLTS